MVTQQQIAGLKYLISASKHGNDTGKRIFWFLIDQSAGFTKSVSLTLTEKKEGYSAKEINAAAHSLDGMWSCNGTTHLDAIMAAMGTELRFSLHYGHFKRGKFDTSGMFAGAPLSMVSNPKLARLNQPMRYTFWLAPGSYSGKSVAVKVTRIKLEAIDLSKPGLYPGIENQRRAS